MTDIDAYVSRVVDAAPPLTDEQISRIARIIANARTAGAANPDRSNQGPGLGLTTDSSGDPGPEVGRAA